MPRLLILVLSLLAASTASAQVASPGESSYATDDRGREFRVSFPLHDRLWVGGGYGLGPGASGELRLGYDLTLAADFAEEEIWWLLRHRIAWCSVRPESDAPLRLTLVGGDYLRHDRASTILIPRNKRDIRLPAPFDIAVVWSLLTLEVAPRESPRIRSARIVDLSLLADLLRDPDYRRRLAFGVKSAYSAEDTGGEWQHIVTPFSALVALWGWEHRSGRFGVSVQSSIGRTARITVPALQWAWRAAAEAEVEWVALAVRDLPLSLVADASIEGDLGAPPTWRVGLGARLALWSAP